MSLVAVGSGSEHPHPDSARLAPTHPAGLNHPLSTAKSLETRQVDEARTNGRFHRYVVDNVRQGNPAAFRLIDLHGDVLARLLERARPQSYVTLPFPVGVYDAAVAKRD